MKFCTFILFVLFLSACDNTRKNNDVLSSEEEQYDSETSVEPRKPGESQAQPTPRVMEPDFFMKKINDNSVELIIVAQEGYHVVSGEFVRGNRWKANIGHGSGRMALRLKAETPKPTRDTHYIETHHRYEHFHLPGEVDDEHLKEHEENIDKLNLMQHKSRVTVLDPRR